MKTLHQTVVDLLAQLSERLSSQASLLHDLSPTMMTWLAGLGLVSLLLIAARVVRSLGGVALIGGALCAFYLAVTHTESNLVHILHGLREVACDSQ